MRVKNRIRAKAKLISIVAPGPILPTVLDNNTSLSRFRISELRHEKPCIQGFGQDQTQTGVYNHRRLLEA